MQKTYFREWRTFRELTQEQAAAAMGTSQSVLSGLESGRKGYSRESLEAMARAYRCEVWQLLGVDPLNPSDSSTVVNMIEALEPATLLELIGRVTKKNR